MGNKIVYKGYNVGETTQVSIMPTATADNSGAIVQYVGATNANYINGYFYKCVSDGAATPTYSWEKIQVSDGGDGTPHWSGTRAEYEAIKDTLEAGTIVNITDDYDDGLGVVDVIEDGNMNPVTSNAVAEALAVIDSPITKVGTAINGNRFWSKRTGNVVEIMIDGTTGSNIPCAQSVVVAKVPKNALTISDVCIEIDSKSLVSAPESGHKRAWVDSTGNVCVFIAMPDLAATYTGNIYIGGTYITAE